MSEKLVMALPLSLPSLQVITSFAPFGTGATADTFHRAGGFEFLEPMADKFTTDTGTKFLQLGHGEFAFLAGQRVFQHFRLGPARTFDLADAPLKFLAGLCEHEEQEIHRRPGIVFAFMPTLGALFQHFVVAFLAVLDDAL
jgi:hypothetical protein